MLVLIDLFIFEVIVAPELGVASSHGVGGFQQVVAKETIAGLDEFPVLGFKLPGLGRNLTLAKDKEMGFRQESDIRP